MSRSIYDIENFRENGHLLIDVLSDYLKEVHNNNIPFSIPDPKDSFAEWENTMSENTDFPTFISAILKGSMHIHSPHYMGHQVSPPILMSCLGGLLSDVLNNGMGVYEMGAAATALENYIVKFCGINLGYKDTSGGFLTSGGTLANTTALLCARSQILGGDVWHDGTFGLRPTVMVSEAAHYCVDRAVKIMGWGSKGITKVPVNNLFQININSLHKKYDEAERKGLKVVAIVGNAGSTGTGSYDDLVALGAFAKEKKLWFHIDGAHGGSATFSNKFKHLVKGINQADSIVIDFHKMMAIPALATLLMFKNKQHSYSTFKQKAEYLLDENESGADLAKRTFECTKYMMSVKIGIAIVQHGTNVFSQYFEKCYNNTQEFYQILLEYSNFEVAIPPESNILCFRYIGNQSSSKDKDKLQSRIRSEIIKSGNFYIVSTRLNKNIYLRCTFMNPLTTDQHFRQLLDEITDIAKK